MASPMSFGAGTSRPAPLSQTRGRDVPAPFYQVHGKEVLVICGRPESAGKRKSRGGVPSGSPPFSISRFPLFPNRPVAFWAIHRRLSRWPPWRFLTWTPAFSSPVARGLPTTSFPNRFQTKPPSPKRLSTLKSKTPPLRSSKAILHRCEASFGSPIQIGPEPTLARMRRP